MMLVIPTLLSAMTFEQYMDAVKSKNKGLQADELSVEAAKDRKAAAEIELSPVLSLGYAYNADKSLPNMLSPERKYEGYTLGLQKKFITGTGFELKSSLAELENVNSVSPAFKNYTTGLLGVSLKQSLWKDFFGRGTRLKIKTAEKMSELEGLATQLKSLGSAINAENVYWDFVYAQENLNLKKANLDRATKLNAWTQKRVVNGIGDSADSYNSQALMALRQLEYAQALTDFKNAEAGLREKLELPSDQPTPAVQATIPLNAQIDLSKKKVKADSATALLQAQADYYKAESSVDDLRPDLSVFGQYNYTSYDSTGNRQTALNDITKSDYPQTTVGVNLTWMFETDAKSGLRTAAKKTALASKLNAEQKMKDGLLEWDSFSKQYVTLKQNISLLQQISDFQKKRAIAENQKLGQGRTITANVITAETDSAEAEVNLLRAQINFKKMEAASRTYVDVDALTIK